MLFRILSGLSLSIWVIFYFVGASTAADLNQLLKGCGNDLSAKNIIQHGGKYFLKISEEHNFVLYTTISPKWNYASSSMSFCWKTDKVYLRISQFYARLNDGVDEKFLSDDGQAKKILKISQDSYEKFTKGLKNLSVLNCINDFFIGRSGKIFVEFHDSYCRPESRIRNHVRKAVLVEERRRKQAETAEQKRAIIEKEKQESREVFESFASRAGIADWPDPAVIVANPFALEGKTIGLQAKFVSMNSKDSGLFELTNGGLVVVIGIGTDAFLKPVQILLAGEAAGKKPVALPLVGETLTTHLKLADFYVCRRTDCEDALRWAKK